MLVFTELIQDLLPAGVLNLITGAGGKSRQYLLDHPDLCNCPMYRLQKRKALPSHAAVIIIQKTAVTKEAYFGCIQPDKEHHDQLK